ncbi:PAS domain S-box-containing protein [Algoriphagus alkaliphilus]|uniref:histidine kinase n=1 Tax=Algoriphagus alkaliphilus TaxID=279824 RepID=A0A1G5WKI0_9BACT|nr:PAS domain S-box protein [Algoriphagus alkaliphilus]SDA58739.1 PAS domain S-box-containing protein [Algoriphagus alkaliphilus]
MEAKMTDYSSLFYLSPLPQLVYDVSTFEILDVNEAAIQQYSFSRNEFLKLTIKGLYPKEEIPKLVAPHIDIDSQHGNIYFGISTHQKKNHEKIRMKINGHKVDFHGQKCILAICLDVTEEEKKTQLIKESEERLKAASAIAKLGYWRFELESQSITWTDEVYKIWGRQKDSFEINFENLLKTIHPEDHEAFDLENDRTIHSGEKNVDIIHRIILPDHSIRWIHAIGRMVKDKHGIPIAFEGTVQDLTAQKLEEQELRLLERVITNTKDALLITEAEHFDEPGNRIIYVNEAFTKMTGYTAEEVIGKTPRILQGPNTNKEELARIGKALRNWESCECTVINYKKNGEEFWINFSSSPVANEMEWYTHWIAIERDVTEQKNKELEKELLNKISLNFSIENDLITSVNELCKTVSSYGNFDFVELWLPNLERNQLQLIAHIPTTSNAGIFDEWSKEVTSFNLAEEAPGIVWLKKSSILWENLSENDAFTRKDAAKKAGIETALTIPLIFNEKVIGVLVVGSQQEINYLKKYVKVFEQLERFIGSEISRKKLENDLHHIYESIPEILCQLDFQGRFLRMNKAGCKALGYSEEELLCHSFDEFVHPEDKDISAIEVMKLSEGEATFKFENRCITKSGNIIWLSWTCSPSVEDGLIYAASKNITEEKKLRELNRQVNSIAKIGSWEVDLLQGKVYWSEMVHELHETDPESYIPNLENAILFYREDFREMVQGAIDKCIQSEVTFDFEAILVTAKGKERWVRAIGNAEFAVGKCHRIYGSFQDIHKRKANEITLHNTLKTLEAFKSALDQSAIIAITDKNGVITEVNDNFCKLSQYSEMELIGNTHQLINSKHHPKAFFKDLWKTISSGKVWKGEIKNMAKDGSYYWVYTSIFPFLDEKNISYQYLSIRFDITKIKIAEEQVLRTLEEKNKILESIGDAFFTVDKNWVVGYWNKQCESLLGINREEILGKNIWEEFPEAVSLPSHTNIHHVMATGESINFEEYDPAFDKWFEVTVYPSKEGLTFYFRDITLRKQADISLVQANERFEKVAEATNDAIWDWNLLDNSLFLGNGFKRLFGHMVDVNLTPIEDWTQNIHPDDQEQVLQSIMDAIEKPNQTNWMAEYRFRKNDGTFANVIDRGVVIRDDGGKAIRMVGAVIDITERKNYEKQLLGLNKSLQQHAHELELTNEQLEQFAFIASHDLQEPLRMISSFLDQLKRKYGGQLDDKAHQYIHFATDGAKRMRQIILDLLEYSRAGKLEENRVKINFDQLVADYKSLRKKIIHEKSVVIDHSPLPVIDGYRAPCTQVIHCLLDNAIKYSREGIAPRIELGVEVTESEWVFSVRDNGIGIAPEFFGKIFVIFQRLHNRDQYGGNGIGLSIVKKQVESWGGKVWLSSKLGEGSVFYFSVPKV